MRFIVELCLFKQLVLVVGIFRLLGEFLPPFCSSFRGMMLTERCYSCCSYEYHREILKSHEDMFKFFKVSFMPLAIGFHYSDVGRKPSYFRGYFYDSRIVFGFPCIISIYC